MSKVNLKTKSLSIVEEKNKECVNCKKCYNLCPMMKNYSDSPKQLMQEIITDKSINMNIPYSCMLCDVCTISCPKDINLKEMFYNLRSDIIKSNIDKVDAIGNNSVKLHQKASYSAFFSNSIVNKKTRRIFLPGCSLSSYSQDIVEKTYLYLRKIYNDISMIVECCGKPTLAMGNEDKFKNYYLRIDKLIKDYEIEEIIVACPNCFDTIKNNSKNVTVTTVWSVISRYGVPEELKNHYIDNSTQYALHDPCPIRYEASIHNQVRSILKDLGVTFIEFEKNRENSQCCGSGAMVRLTNTEISLNQTINRANQTKADTIICYCESCCESMLIANKKSLHILDFMFNEKVINKHIVTQTNSSTISKWKMRYKTARISKKAKI